MALTQCTPTRRWPPASASTRSPSLAVHPFLNKVMPDEELDT